MYASKAVSKIELLIEFMFEAMHEKSEPVVGLFELVKMVCRLKEYYSLIYKVKVHTYIDMEDY